MVNLSTRKTAGLTKMERSNIAYFDRYLSTSFESLRHMLVKDYCYSPFNFIGHHRGRGNICSTANLVVLDVDHTNISIHDRYKELLDEGLKFIIGTTSDHTNLYKYRVLMPLSRPVEPHEYSLLVRGIEANKLVSNLDISASIKASGFMFSYSGSLVLTNFNGSLLPVDDYILEPTEVEYSTADPTEAIEDFDNLFKSFSRANKGSRSKALLRAAYTMYEYGFSLEQMTTGVLRINERFLVPKSKQEVYRRVINFIEQTKYRNNK